MLLAHVQTILQHTSVKTDKKKSFSDEADLAIMYLV
jgi:hypothetical protein